LNDSLTSSSSFTVSRKEACVAVHSIKHNLYGVSIGITLQTKIIYVLSRATFTSGVGRVCVAEQKK